jgi:hypothetical protein
VYSYFPSGNNTNLDLVIIITHKISTYGAQSFPKPAYPLHMAATFSIQGQGRQSQTHGLEPRGGCALLQAQDFTFSWSQAFILPYVTVALTSESTTRCSLSNLKVLGVEVVGAISAAVIATIATIDASIKIYDRA